MLARASPHAPRLKPNDPIRGTPTTRYFARRRLLVMGGDLAVSAFARRDALPARVGVPIASSPDLEDAARRGSLCTARDAVGVGLLGKYFSLEGCHGPTLLTRIDPVVDFDAALDWPTDHIRTLPRSARWSGWIRAPLDGRYRFHLDADAASVTVARQPMLEPDATIALHAGRYYPLQAALERMPGHSRRIQLEWTAPHGARYVIPRSLLQIPTPAESRRT
jgi:hypothetical protein